MSIAASCQIVVAEIRAGIRDRYVHFVILHLLFAASWCQLMKTAADVPFSEAPPGLRFVERPMW